jgi:hypothetical protein
MKMGCDHAAPRRPVSRNADLVEHCKSEFGSLSAHVGARLAAGLGTCAAAVKTESRRTVRAIDASSALYNAHGGLSEEMQSL